MSEVCCKACKSIGDVCPECQKDYPPSRSDYSALQRKYDAAIEALDSLCSGTRMEQMADMEHERWANWIKHMMNESPMDKESGIVQFHPMRLKGWLRQSITPYALLSEAEKESDRREVRVQLVQSGLYEYTDDTKTAIRRK